MKQIFPIAFLLFSVTSFTQTEHWQFGDSLSGENGIRFEIYTAPGKYAAINTSAGQVSRTVVDSAIRQRLDLCDSREGRYFVRTTLEAPLSVTFRSEGSEQEEANMEAMEEMRPKIGREGLDFRLLPDTKKLFGLTLHHIELLAEDPQYNNARMRIGEGWLLIGKTIPTMQEQVLSDGRSGVIVESAMRWGTDTHYQKLVGYSAGKTAPQGTFSLTIPAGYTDLKETIQNDPPVKTEPVKSVVIDENK